MKFYDTNLFSIQKLFMTPIHQVCVKYVHEFVDLRLKKINLLYIIYKEAANFSNLHWLNQDFI